MSLIGKTLVSLIVAAAASALTAVLLGRNPLDPLLLACFAGATIITAILVTLPPSQQSATQQADGEKKRPAKASKKRARTTGNREEGTVKWFNVSKGFGFITRENGEEIFVHFRSILGEGRRSLRDGQLVSFEVADSDKGPQAEEVEALD